MILLIAQLKNYNFYIILYFEKLQLFRKDDDSFELEEEDCVSFDGIICFYSKSKHAIYLLILTLDDKKMSYYNVRYFKKNMDAFFQMK